MWVDHSQASPRHVKSSTGVLTPAWKQEKELVSWWKLDLWPLIKRRCVISLADILASTLICPWKAAPSGSADMLAFICSVEPDNCRSTTVPHSTHSRISQQALQASLNKSRSSLGVNFTQWRGCGLLQPSSVCSHTKTSTIFVKCLTFLLVSQARRDFTPLPRGWEGSGHFLLLIRAGFLVQNGRTVVKHFHPEVCWQSWKQTNLFPLWANAKHTGALTPNPETEE